MNPKGAGGLDRRLEIQRYTETSSGDFNEPVGSWTNYATVWANRNDVRDTEKVAAGQVSGAIMTRFTIRSTVLSRAILVSDRIVYDSKNWQILGIKETAEGGRNNYLEITAVSESD